MYCTKYPIVCQALALDQVEYQKPSQCDGDDSNHDSPLSLSVCSTLSCVVEVGRNDAASLTQTEFKIKLLMNACVA